MTSLLDALQRHPSQLVLSLLVLGLSYAGYIAIYRLTLHPLRQYPGPKLAGLTKCYAFYYEVIKKGAFTAHIRELHRQYGPIVRIAPNEVHIDDPDFFEEFYAKNGRLDKDPHLSGFFGNSISLLSTVPSELHRIRRAPLVYPFSRKRILELQPVLRDKVRKLIDRVGEYAQSNEPLVLDRAFMALSEDMITQYCFGRCYDKIDQPNFDKNLHESFKTISQTGYTAIYFPWIPKLLLRLPSSLLTVVEPKYAALFQYQSDVLTWAQEIHEAGGDMTTGRNDHAAVLKELIYSDLPPAEKELPRIGAEAQNLLGAGVSTSGWTATVTMFHIVNNSQVYQKLRKELIDAFPDAQDCLDWLRLERLPYLQACIKEGVRLALAVSIRSPRVPNHPLVYNEYTIPPGTCVSMSVVDVSLNGQIFPEPEIFRPERWLMPSPPEDSYFVFFGKGSRSCLGMQLALAELYQMIGGLVRNFELELHETDITDIKMAHDFFLPLPRLDSQGVQVKVRKMNHASVTQRLRQAADRSSSPDTAAADGDVCSGGV